MKYYIIKLMILMTNDVIINNTVWHKYSKECLPPIGVEVIAFNHK